MRTLARRKQTRGGVEALGEDAPVPIRAPALLLVVLSFLAGTSAAAQDQRPRFELFVQGGVSSFTSTSRTVASPLSSPPFPPSTTQSFRFRSSFGTTGRVFTGLRYYFTPNNAVEASYAYSPNHLQSSIKAFATPPTPLFPGGSAFFTRSMHVHSVSFNYVRYLRRSDRFGVFATGGLGFVGYHIEFEAQDKLSGNFGGGVDARLRPHVYLRAEFRDTISKRPRFSAVPGTAHNLTPSVGLAFRF